MEDARPRTVDISRDRPSPDPRRILVTNDDGIDAPGLRRLAAALADRHEVIVAAPAHDVSGAGTSMGRYDPAAATGLERRDFDGIEAYALEGPPGLAVMAAALGAFGRPPGLVVSGVNAGMNTGHSVIHSGTVGGALTGHTFGAVGVAVSLAASDPWHWDTSAAVGTAVVDWLVEQSDRMVINVNVPAAQLSELRGCRWAPLDHFGHFRVASADVPGGTLELEVTADGEQPDPGSDTALCRAGYVTLTLLSPVEAVPPPDIDAEAVVGLPGNGRA